MRLLLYLFVLIISPWQIDGFKYLVYNPLRGRSHVNFMGKISDILIEAGHEVVMLAPIIDSSLTDGGTDKVQNIIRIPPCEASAILAEPNKFWTSKPFLESLRQTFAFFYAWADQCNATINHLGLLESLKEEKFDAAITEPSDLCGYGIFRHIGIESIATILSISSNEGSFYFTGLPSFPSYVPGSFSSFGDKMTFLQRVVNTLSVGLGNYFYPMTLKPTERILKSNFGSEFPHLYGLVSSTSLWFLAAEPLIDFPRPILHKVIDIGGIGISTERKSLNKTWSDILDLRPQTVLLSFGSVSKSSLIPDDYKQTIRAVFRKFPNVTFIWKYENPNDKISEGIPNLIESTWVPQSDMLFDARLSLFITHCGPASLHEATNAGIPLIGIPLHADQIRNGVVVNRIEVGVVLKKRDLERPEPLESAIKKVLSYERYRKKAKSISQMIRNRPFSSREMFVRNMEFLAQFGPLRMLDHSGKELTFIEYYLIDVCTFPVSLSIVSIFVVHKLAKLGLSHCFSKGKEKIE